MSPIDAALAGGILFVAYFVRGIAGFGSGLIAVPLLALFLPLTQAVPTVMLLDLAASLWLGRTEREQVQWQEVRTLIGPTLLGLLLGTTLLVSAPQTLILTTLGGYILLAGVRNLFMSMENPRPVSRGWAIPAGLIGGAISGLFGTGGPPYVIYISRRLRDKRHIRATLSAIFMLDGGARFLVGLFAGLLAHASLWWSLLAGLPILILGMHLGGHVHLRLANHTLLRLIGVLLIGAGCAVLLKAARG